MILEGLISTRNADGSVNLAPMGPLVDEDLRSFVLRPFQSSRTYQNLRDRPSAVFHVTDDVCLLAQAAINELPQLPPLQPAVAIEGFVISGCCRWYELTVTGRDDSTERSVLHTRIEHVGLGRDFFGFNRAKHAVLEAAILATRLHLLSPESVREEFERLRIPVTKTAGPREIEAFELLSRYVTRRMAGDCLATESMSQPVEGLA